MDKPVYHYTTLRALFGILRNRELWLTDFRFLNDSQEFYLAERIAANTLRQISFSPQEKELSTKSDHKELLQLWSVFVRNFKENFIRLNFTEFFWRSSLPYVFSLSEKKDSLSQWRAYGNGEVCIEFDPQRLEAVANGPLVQVAYKRETEIDIDLSKQIDRYLDKEFRKLVEHGRFGGQTLGTGARDLYPYIRDHFRPMGIKHEGFREEGEWRIVVEFVPGFQHGASQVTFFDEVGYPTPRAKVRFRPELRLPEIVTGIMFGPGSDQRQARDLVQTLNLTLGTCYEPQFSSIPYRT